METDLTCKAMKRQQSVQSNETKSIKFTVIADNIAMISFQSSLKISEQQGQMLFI